MYSADVLSQFVRPFPASPCIRKDLDRFANLGQRRRRTVTEFHNLLEQQLT